MGNYQKIFLIVDPSRRHTPAMLRAIHLARATGASLHLGLYEHSAAISAVGLVDREVMALAHRAYVEEREHWLESVARELCDEGVEARAEVDLRTPAHDAICARVLEMRPDLVVKDAHHERALARVLFTPLDWQLLRLCPAPLLLVTSRIPHGPRRVVCAVDTLEPDGAAALNERIVAESLRLSRQLEAELHVVHVFEGAPAVAGGAMESLEGVMQAYEQLAQLDRERFEQFVQQHGIPSECAHRVEGFAAPALAEFAQEARADVLVLGTVRRTGLARIILGSTAERLLDKVHCDVLAVKPQGFDADIARHLGVGAPSRQAA